MISYRDATSADVPALARIRAAEWESYEYWVKRISAYMTRELQPQKALMPRIVIVAENAGKNANRVVGFISGHLTHRLGCDGELQWINVAAPWRGTGVAPELLARLAAWFCTHNAKRICVDPDQRSRSFYVRHGAHELTRHWLVWDDIGTVLQSSERTQKANQKAPEG